MFGGYNIACKSQDVYRVMMVNKRGTSFVYDRIV